MSSLLQRQQQFISKAKIAHNSVYSYANVAYLNSGTKVSVTCSEHGDFMVTPDNHTGRKSGCPKCALQKASTRYSDTTESFITKAMNIHKNSYDYSSVTYSSSKTPVSIRCIKHNAVFLQTPTNHISGAGCPQCALDSRSTIRTLPLADFISKATAIHNNKYDYSKITLVEYKSKRITIICPSHGEFKQNKHDHTRSKAGCPKCNSSKGENAVRQTLIQNNIQFEEQKTFKDLYYKNKKAKLRYDFYLPTHNILIEYDGQGHYRPSHRSSLQEFNEGCIRDGLKDKYARDNELLLLRIPYFKFAEIEHIIKAQLKIK